MNILAAKMTGHFRRSISGSNSGSVVARLHVASESASAGAKAYPMGTRTRAGKTPAVKLPAGNYPGSYPGYPC
jgi:hypothetical protein